jgi:hypothetical protein
MFISWNSVFHLFLSAWVPFKWIFFIWLKEFLFPRFLFGLFKNIIKFPFHIYYCLLYIFYFFVFIQMFLCILLIVSVPSSVYPYFLGFVDLFLCILFNLLNCCIISLLSSETEVWSPALSIRPFVDLLRCHILLPFSVSNASEICSSSVDYLFGGFSHLKPWLNFY